MIITRELIQRTTCEEAQGWADQHPYIYNLDRKEFAKVIRQEERSGRTPNNWWADWVDEEYKKGTAVAYSGKFKRLGIYKLITPNMPTQEFDNIEDALAVLEIAKNEILKTEEDLFHIQVRHRRGPNGYEIIQFCDTKKDSCDVSTTDEYFSTFNILTGAYEDYPTYTEARNRMIQIRTEREMQHADSFGIAEKIAEVGGADANYEDYVAVQSLKGRKTEFDYLLDKVQRRPDPKPKKL